MTLDVDPDVLWRRVADLRPALPRGDKGLSSHEILQWLRSHHPKDSLPSEMTIRRRLTRAVRAGVLASGVGYRYSPRGRVCRVTVYRPS